MMGKFYGNTKEFCIYGFHSAKCALRCWVTSFLLCQQSSGWHGARHGTRPSVILLTKHQATDSNRHPGRKEGRKRWRVGAGGGIEMVLGANLPALLASITHPTWLFRWHLIYSHWGKTAKMKSSGNQGKFSYDFYEGQRPRWASRHSAAFFISVLPL